MKRILCLVLLAAAVTAPRAASEIIRLKNGKELQCEILSCSEEEGITVRRLDTGGVFKLRWEHLLPADAAAIKTAQGFADENAQRVLVQAKRVVLRNGTFEDGIPVKSDRPGTYCLQRRGKRYYYRQPEVVEIRTVEVEAPEVYTLDELYRMKIQEQAPVAARDWFNLGVYLESVTYYPKALEAYQKVKELDETFKPEVIDRKIRLMEEKIKEADATAYLDEVKRLIYRRRFALAIERLEGFEEQFPDSVQKGLKEKLIADARRKRHEYYQQKIITDFFTYMDRVAYKAAVDKNMTLQAALQFATEEMGSAIRDKLAQAYRIDPEEVDDLWKNRKGGAPRTAGYGTGTFILGREKARSRPDKEAKPAEEQQEKEQKKPQTLDERLRQRIEEIKKQQAKMRGAKKSRVRMDEIGRSPEEWWKTETMANRKRLLIAYYAEFSGDMKIQRVKFNPCPHCGGKGYLERLGASGEEDKRIPCEVCKTLGFERTVVFK